MTQDFERRLQQIDEDTSAESRIQDDRVAALVARIGQPERRPQPGQPAPDFAMPSAEGRLVTRDALLDRRALCLVFIRGLWCRYCNAQLAAFQTAERAYAAAGVRIAVVTPEVGGRALETKQTLGLSCDVLCDVDEGVALAYGCLFRVPAEYRADLIATGKDLAPLYGNDAWLIPLASTFLISTRGEVLAVFGGADQRHRPDPQDILQTAEALLAAGSASGSGAEDGGIAPLAR